MSSIGQTRFGNEQQQQQQQEELSRNKTFVAGVENQFLWPHPSLMSE